MDLSNFGPRHRCTTKIAREPTRLEAEKIARGEMTAADLLPKGKPAAAQSLGRLAARQPAEASQARQPASKPCCLADVIKELAEVKAMLLELKPRPDA